MAVCVFCLRRFKPNPKATVRQKYCSGRCSKRATYQREQADPARKAKRQSYVVKRRKANPEPGREAARRFKRTEKYQQWKLFNAERLKGFGRRSALAHYAKNRESILPLNRQRYRRDRAANPDRYRAYKAKFLSTEKGKRSNAVSYFLAKTKGIPEDVRRLLWLVYLMGKRERGKLPASQATAYMQMLDVSAWNR